MILNPQSIDPRNLANLINTRISSSSNPGCDECILWFTYNGNIFEPLPYIVHDTFHIAVGFKKSKSC